MLNIPFVHGDTSNLYEGGTISQRGGILHTETTIPVVVLLMTPFKSGLKIKQTPAFHMSLESGKAEGLKHF